MKTHQDISRSSSNDTLHHIANVSLCQLEIWHKPRSSPVSSHQKRIPTPRTKRDKVLGQNETKFDPRAEWNFISRIASFSRCWRLGVTKRQNESKNDPSGCKACSSLHQIDHRAIILRVSFISRILAINITGTSQQRAPQSFRWCGSKIAAEGLSRLSRQVTSVESCAKHAQSGSPCGTRLEQSYFANYNLLQWKSCSRAWTIKI